MNPLADATILAAEGRTAPALPDPAQPPADEIEVPTNGAILFARYAYPPNELGYCGPPDHKALLEYGSERTFDAGLVELARGFAGAWPYLEFIAAATGIRTPLDRRVVEAYWLGGELLERIDMVRFGNSLLDRFRKRAGQGWATSPRRSRRARSRITPSTSSASTRGSGCSRRSGSRRRSSTSTSAASDGARSSRPTVTGSPSCPGR